MNLSALCRHTLIVLAGVFLLLGLPFMCTEFFRDSVLGSGRDAISSASLYVEPKSGDYILFVNRRFHSSDEGLDSILDEGKGSRIEVSFGDVGAHALVEEKGGRVAVSDPILMLSRMNHGRFDSVLMSREFYSLTDGFLFPDEDTSRIDIVGGGK